MRDASALRACIICAAVALFPSSGFCAGEFDTYKSFTELKAKAVEGKNYRVTVHDRQTPVSVFVIHGGSIEPAAQKVAETCAGNAYSFYLFEGFSGRKWRKYHITATNFDDPAAIALSTSSVLALAFHEQYDKTNSICMGGKNTDARDAIAAALREHGFEVECPCRRFPGTDDRNIVNMAVHGGVQFEMSAYIAGKLESDERLREKLCRAIMQSADAFVKDLR